MEEMRETLDVFVIRFRFGLFDTQLPKTQRILIILSVPDNKITCFLIVNIGILSFDIATKSRHTVKPV